MLRLSSVTVSFDDRLLLESADLLVEPGQLVAIVGPSGVGKTSLLRCAAGLERPTAGQIWYKERDLTALPERERRRIRLAEMGLLFEGAGLLPELTILDNVALPLRLSRSGLARSEARLRAATVLGELGVSDLEAARPNVVSSGEKRRVLLARAMVTSPCLLIADEPTAMLDSQTTHDVAATIRRVADTCSAIVVTHDQALASVADVVYSFADTSLQVLGRGGQT